MIKKRISANIGLFHIKQKREAQKTSRPKKNYVVKLHGKNINFNHSIYSFVQKLS